MTGARPDRTTPPQRPEVSWFRSTPVTLFVDVKMMGRVAVPLAWMVLPRLTFRKLDPEATMIAPGSIVSSTFVSFAVAVGPPSVPTSTRPFMRYTSPSTKGSVVLALKTAGKMQTRYSPVGPVSVPSSARPAGLEIVGHSAAAVTGPEVGVGVGAGVGAGVAGGLMMMSPPVPGETISSAPQLARARAEQPSTSER